MPRYHTKQNENYYTINRNLSKILSLFACSKVPFPPPPTAPCHLPTSTISPLSHTLQLPLLLLNFPFYSHNPSPLPLIYHCQRDSITHPPSFTNWAYMSGLSKVASCWHKSAPTWLVSASYSAWYFFMDGLFKWNISGLAANFDNSAVYFKTFWQPWHEGVPAPSQYNSCNCHYHCWHYITTTTSVYLITW